LLRHEVRFAGPGANWTQAHLGWLADGADHEPGDACSGGTRGVEGALAGPAGRRVAGVCRNGS
jgi:hypothetical protein